jgi:hypothetical protein
MSQCNDAPLNGPADGLVMIKRSNTTAYSNTSIVLLDCPRDWSVAAPWDGNSGLGPVPKPLVADDGE